MPTVISSVLQGFNSADTLMRGSAVNIATSLQRAEAAEEARLSGETTRLDSVLKTDGLSTAQIEEMRMLSSVGLESDLVNQRIGLAMYAANAAMLETWDETTGRTLDRTL